MVKQKLDLLCVIIFRLVVGFEKINQSNLTLTHTYLDRLLFYLFQCHYSISKAAALLGVGTKNVYVVPSDNR